METNKQAELCKTCGCFRANHKRNGCTSTYKQGTEFCDCTKFVPKDEISHQVEQEGVSRLLELWSTEPHVQSVIKEAYQEGFDAGLEVKIRPLDEEYQAGKQAGVIAENSRWRGLLENFEIDRGDGKDIEEIAKKFGVPDSVAAIRILDLKLTDLLNKEKE